MNRRRMILMNGQEEDGMKEWETIIDYTTTEDTAEFFCDTDVGGKPFKLKECMVYLKTMPCEDNDKTEVLIKLSFGKKSAWSNSVTSVSSSVKNTDKYFKTCVHFQRIAGVIYPVEFFRSFNKHSVCDEMTATQLPGAYGVFSMDDNFAVNNSVECIESICIGSYQKVIGKGTHLKVVGIRA